MDKKVKWTKVEIGLLVVFGLIFIICFIILINNLQTPNPYENLSWIDRENFDKYMAFEDDRFNRFTIFFIIMLVSGFFWFVPIVMHNKRQKQLDEENYYNYLYSLGEKELQMEYIRLQKEANDTTKTTNALLGMSIINQMWRK